MIQDAIKAYQEYGFRCEKKHLQNGILVFTLNNGYFNNAEIVAEVESDHVKKVREDYTAAGYACTFRLIRRAEDVELELFKGFFFIESTKDRLKADYLRFTKSITSFYSDAATYQYINAPYTLNDLPGEKPITSEVVSRLGDPKPALFLIEAAAGFGKTCTAYELVNEMLAGKNFLPLFSELSRNRAAKIFRYVLLDEIDRTFPQLKSRLVESEILKGRVIVVLDGFDELLRKSDNGDDFESAEPMLETIGQLLQNRAKVVLTTRRTVIFEGDEFHRWMDQNVDKFDVLRFRLSEPRIEDWLAPARRDRLLSAGFNIDGIANPVLLSYLRCISDLEFEQLATRKDELVDKYFEYMLERERTRQDLRLDVQGQYHVLTGIAKDMIELGYTSEGREYIVDLIKTSFVRVLDEVRARYAAAEKPSRDEIANKLASHALLDKSRSDESKIGFINEFVFGNFVAENVIDSDEWLIDDLRFLEPAVVSYVPRTPELKHKLKNCLADVLEFLDWTSRIDFTVKLIGQLDFELADGEADSLVLEDLLIGRPAVRQFQFNDCSFSRCRFEMKGLTQVTFLNCRFYECIVDDDSDRGGSIHVLGCLGDPSVLDRLAKAEESGRSAIAETREQTVDRFILEKFWPVGTQSFHRRRPVKGICSRNNEFSPTELYNGIVSLKRRGILFEPSKPSFVEISLERIGEIRRILGRGSQ